jgi:hypothetical protein
MTAVQRFLGFGAGVVVIYTGLSKGLYSFFYDLDES